MVYSTCLKETAESPRRKNLWGFCLLKRIRMGLIFRYLEGDYMVHFPLKSVNDTAEIRTYKYTSVYLCDIIIIKRYLIFYGKVRGDVLYDQISPIKLSKYVIDYVSKFKKDVSHLKLQKLLYYIEAWHLVSFEEPLFEEDFEAWVHGPVIREVFNHYKEESLLNNILPSGTLNYNIEDYLSEEQVEVINDVLDEYGKQSPYHLECLTHDEFPWKKARRGYGSSDCCEETISKKTMENFYRELSDEQ
jgi:uncharacterized phage-associated protein